jgi:hypothetical protein
LGQGLQRGKLMPQWTPTQIWKGQDVFIIGGGPSLRTFDWSRLVPENTIGCNNAFRLGPEVCKVCLFVDSGFIFAGPNKPRKGFYDELAKFPNLVVTNDNQMKFASEPWIKWIPRGQKGMFHDKLGYNFSCGASAVNLACLFGATTIYLLGFDMHLDVNGKPNWHEHILTKPSSEVYNRMLASFGHVKRDLVKFPGTRVFNVNEDSRLNLFPKLNPKVFWTERRNNVLARVG